MENREIKKICREIPLLRDYCVAQFVDKGWSEEKKFYVQTHKGGRFNLRISPLASFETRKREFEALEKVRELGITMSQPVDIGKCGKGKYVYVLLSWVEGESLDESIGKLNIEEQYAVGFEAGEILKKIHSISAPENLENWEERMGRKIQLRLEKYCESGVKIKNGHLAQNFIQDNLHLLKNRPQVFQHGDYHIGNLILTPGKKLGVIDFNRWDYGDPFEEFHKMEMFSREKSISFCRGQLDGYFPTGIPENFFLLISLYLASVLLYSPVWAQPYGEEEVAYMKKKAEEIMADSENFRSPVPLWLRETKTEINEGAGQTRFGRSSFSVKREK